MSHSANRFGPRYFRSRGFLPEDERKALEAKLRCCSICGLELWKGQERAPGIRAHLDCVIDLEQAADQQHDADEGRPWI